MPLHVHESVKECACGFEHMSVGVSIGVCVGVSVMGVFLCVVVNMGVGMVIYAWASEFGCVLGERHE